MGKQESPQMGKQVMGVDEAEALLPWLPGRHLGDLQRGDRAASTGLHVYLPGPPAPICSSL